MDSAETEKMKKDYDIYLFDFLFADLDTIIDSRAMSFEEYCKSKLHIDSK